MLSQLSLSIQFFFFFFNLVVARVVRWKLGGEVEVGGSWRLSAEDSQFLVI